MTTNAQPTNQTTRKLKSQLFWLGVLLPLVSISCFVFALTSEVAEFINEQSKLFDFPMTEEENEEFALLLAYQMYVNEILRLLMLLALTTSILGVYIAMTSRKIA